MPFDTAQIVTATITVLTPFMPFLIEAGKTGRTKLAEVIAEKGGEAAWEKAQNLWGKLKSRIGNDPEVQSAATMVAAKPEDENRQAMLAEILSEHLKNDPNLAQELIDALGGQEKVQEMIADQNSLLVKVTQHLKGSGKQTMKATGGSGIVDAKQIIE